MLTTRELGQRFGRFMIARAAAVVEGTSLEAVELLPPQLVMNKEWRIGIAEAFLASLEAKLEKALPLVAQLEAEGRATPAHRKGLQRMRDQQSAYRDKIVRLKIDAVLEEVGHEL